MSQERPKLTDDENVRKIATVGIVGALVLAGLVSILWAWFGGRGHGGSMVHDDAQRMPAVPRPGYLSRPLNEYEWVDRERGIIAIPIERAMDLVVRRYGGRPSHPAPDPRAGHQPPWSSDDRPSPDVRPFDRGAMEDETWE